MFRTEDPPVQEELYIDIDIVTGSGARQELTLRPELGDTEIEAAGYTEFFSTRLNQTVRVYHRHVAVYSRRERMVKQVPKKIDGKETA